MTTITRLVRGGMLAAAMSLANCTGGLAPLTPDVAATTPDQVAGTGSIPSALLFVADNFNNEIDIFAQDKPRRVIGTIRRDIASPTGLAVDQANNLYVANDSARSVVVFAPPYTRKPIRTYSGGFSDPVAVAVGANGAVYVSDYTDGLLVEYPPHSTKSSHIISLTGRPTGIAPDSNNNFFVAYEAYTGFSGVLEFKAGSTSFEDVGIRVEFAGGVTFDSSGNLLLEDELAKSINVYKPGSTNPSRVITNGFLNPISLAFTADRKRLYVADAGALDVEAISYPGTKPSLGSLDSADRTAWRSAPRPRSNEPS